MVFTQKDKDFINQRWYKTIQQFRDDFDKWENHNKIDYVKQLIEISDLKIQSGLLDIETSDIANYLIVQLTDYDVSEDTIYRACTPEQKGKYSKSCNLQDLKESKWEQAAKSDTELLEKDQFGHYKINNEEYVKITVTHDKKETDSIDPKNTKDDKITRILDDGKQCGNKIEVIFVAFLNKYNESDDYEKLIKNHFKDKSEFYEKQYAKLYTARSEIDERNKWGDYEKIMAKFLIDTGQSTAHIAELLNYSSKYGSIGIDRHGEFVDPQTKEFKKELLEFLMRCPNCHDNIYHRINEDIKRYRKAQELGIEPELEIETPDLGSV